MTRITYNASQLDDMRTLLTKLNYIRKLLEEYPSQQWFNCTTTFTTLTINQVINEDKTSLELLGREPVVSDFVVLYASSDNQVYLAQILTYADGFFSMKILGKLGYEGAKGDKGDKGDTGNTGADGSDGTDGISITDVEVTSSNQLLVTLSNGNVINAGTINTGGSVDLTPFLKASNLTATSPIIISSILGQDGFYHLNILVNANYKILTTGEYQELYTNRVQSLGGATGTITLGSGLSISGNVLSATASGMTNPMTNQGDLIVGGATGTPSRLPIGASGKVLKSTGTNVVWADESGGGGSGLTGYTLTLKHKSGNKLFIVYNDNSYELINMTDSNTHIHNNVLCFYVDIYDQAYVDLTQGNQGILVADYTNTSTYSHVLYINGNQIQAYKYTIYGDVKATVFGGGN